MGVIGKTLRFVVGLTLGAGVGAAAAMLVAPQSGKVTKEQIQGRVNEMMKAAKSAQRGREKELQDYWEQEINVKYKEDEVKKDK
ncbi:MAG: YtxH domain-containing protein [Chloroflexota bacterium]|nr:YtxH domain-containing protein [Chloroflexota bacterium]